MNDKKIIAYALGPTILFLVSLYQYYVKNNISTDTFFICIDIYGSVLPLFCALAERDKK